MKSVFDNAYLKWKYKIKYQVSFLKTDHNQKSGQTEIIILENFLSLQKLGKQKVFLVFYCKIEKLSFVCESPAFRE